MTILRTFLICAFSFSCFICAAQSDGGAVPFAGIVTDARSAGIAESGVASSGDAYSIFRNAAGVSTTDIKGEVAYSYAPWMRKLISGSHLHSVGGFYKINEEHSVLAGFRHFSSPEIEIFDDHGVSIDKVKPRDMSFDVGYSYRIIPKLSVSATARYINSDPGYTSSAGAVAFDLGVFFRNPIKCIGEGSSWTLGLQASNFGSKIKFEETEYTLSRRIGIGGGIDMNLNSYHRLAGTLAVDYLMPFSGDGAIEGGAGAEYTYNNLLTVRGGYHLADKDKGRYSYGSAGLGVSASYFRLDAAYWFAAKDSPYRETFFLTLGVNLGFIK